MRPLFLSRPYMAGPSSTRSSSSSRSICPAFPRFHSKWDSVAAVLDGPGQVLRWGTHGPEPGTAAAGRAGHDQLLQKQILSLGTVGKMYEWQQSPDLHHTLAFKSLGRRTQDQWPSIQSVLDQGEPVALTLIASSNDYNPVHMIRHHRVIAFGYEIRGLTEDDWVHGKKREKIRRVDLAIYDPNYPREDDVALYFHLDCDDDWIGLTPNREGSFHGFFKDGNHN